MSAVNHRTHLHSSPWDWSSSHTGTHRTRTQHIHRAGIQPLLTLATQSPHTRHGTREFTLELQRGGRGGVQRIQSDQGPVADANDQEDEGDQRVEHSGHHLAHSSVGRQEQPAGTSALRSLSQA